MFAFRPGVWPVSRPRAVIVAVAAFLGTGLSGCASNQNAQAISSSAVMNSGATNAPAVMSWNVFDSGPEPMPRPVAVKEDLEDDGLAAQTPPQKSIRTQHDDPTQPWSPNYGRTGGVPSRQAQDGIVVPSQASSLGKQWTPAQMASQDTE